MIKNILSSASATILLTAVFHSTCHAAAFLPSEARGLAMGGTGVAAGNSRQAHYYNPSLLMNAKEDEDFNFEIDATARASDNDGLLNSMKTFSDEEYLLTFGDSLANLGSAIQNAKNTISDPFKSVEAKRQAIQSVIVSRDSLVTASKNLQNGIQSITNKNPNCYDEC